MKRILALAIFVCLLLGVAGALDENKSLELKACGARDNEVKFSADTDKSKHPTPEPSAGKAMVYVLRPTIMGNKVQTTLAVDGDWKGVNRGNNYFFFELEPGEHYICSKAENRDTLTLKVEAGKTYFLQQHVSIGVMKARNSLEIMSDEQAREKLAKLHLATWEKK